jgi:PAS domain S-box-containing protein
MASPRAATSFADLLTKRHNVFNYFLRISLQRGVNQAMAAQRILIVVDEIIIARELEARLTGFGYEVAGITSSGREAIAMVAKTEPNLVLMDIGLRGDMTGIEAAEGIGQCWPIPIIFLIADTDEATLRSTKVPEPFSYVVTPFTERELRIIIDMALYKDDTKKQAQEFEERFFAVSIDMLCFLDFSGYFKRLNPAWEKILGFTREELLSKPFIEFVHPDDRERTLKQNRKVRAGEKALSFENRYLCKDGSYKWLLWNAAPDLDNQVIYSVARDITGRKKAEEERETLLKELQAALAEVKSLQEILPICSYCKKIRNDKNYWQTVETYISQHTNTKFSHSICPNCYTTEVEPQLEKISSK